jgi:hypothetical protein
MSGRFGIRSELSSAVFNQLIWVTALLAAIALF